MYSIWGKSANVDADRDVFDEMKRHAIAALPAQRLSSLNLPPELATEWKKEIIQQASFYTVYCLKQSKLPLTVPYVILKGTSAAKYYPCPEFRMMGDIDIMTRREDFDIACKQLMDDGYTMLKDIYKEAELIKDGIQIDIHRQFASLNNPDHVKYLDDLIISNINPSHVLPDCINGLVLIDHINQHLEEGLGLRQIIDWMMYVDKCLPDEKAPEFLAEAEKIGLDKLAVVCTRMCEIYLGLPHREWCAKADVKLCEQLMDYVMACGNFGNKKQSDSDISEKAFTYARSIKSGFGLLQSQGLINWEAAQRYRILRPFAWVYQLFRYLVRGLRREKAAAKIKAEYAAAKRKTALLDALGVKTATKGLVMYKDGKYIKE